MSRAKQIGFSVACILGGALSVNWLLQLWPMPIFPVWGCLIAMYLLRPERP